MLSTARVELPAQIEIQLKAAAEFVDNLMDFARDDLIGFRRPLAAAFALSAPVVLALVFWSLGLRAMLEVGVGYFAIAGAGLALIGSKLWPGLVEEFDARSFAKRKAIADLKCGFGEASFLNLTRASRVFEHECGAIALADAGDLRTLFFSIESGEHDPRWALYRAGELNRRVWRWLRLPVSRELVKFATEGSKHPETQSPRMIRSIDAYEAVHLALGEPLDGAIIHRPFDEVVDMVERLL